MANVKLPPRQRMINMMYIVLIAMLALNVDKHVLKAFHLMEKNFISSAESYDQKNNLQMAGFLQLVNKEEEKARPYYEAAKEAQKISSDFDTYIATIKTDIEEMYNGRIDVEEGQEGITPLKTPEGMEKHARLFMVENKGQKAKELQSKINETRDKLLNLLKPQGDELFVDKNLYNQAAQANLLSAEEPVQTGVSKQSWASINLEYQPAGALLANLTQYQNNAKALEADVISKLIYGVNQSSHIIDELNAAIIPQSNYVMEGENYKADVMLIATSSSAIPKITMNGSNLESMDAGVGKINIRASGIGAKTVKGTIEVADPKTGKPTLYPYEHTYQVFKPVATVSADAMKIVYVKLDNPMGISVPGFSAADIKVTASSGATISGGNGRYKVSADGSTRKISISVSAKGRSMGTTEYKVRQIPEPRAQLGGVRNDGRAKLIGELKAQDRVLANLGEGFAYDLPFQVTSYRIILDSRRGVVTRQVSGNLIPTDIRQKISTMKSGDRILIEEVKARNTAYGITKNGSPATYTIR
jgi:gliding motility-associated protein GldM